jgi:hypothetical protein
MAGSMDYEPGRVEALARAHEMRAMRADGLSLDLIAALFKYQPHDVATIIRWHERLHPEMPAYEGDCAGWREFKGRYLRGRL